MASILLIPKARMRWRRNLKGVSHDGDGQKQLKILAPVRFRGTYQLIPFLEKFISLDGPFKFLFLGEGGGGVSCLHCRRWRAHLWRITIADCNLGNWDPPQDSNQELQICWRILFSCLVLKLQANFSLWRSTKKTSYTKSLRDTEPKR